MSLSDRLRTEARRIQPTADDRLAARIIAAVHAVAIPMPMPVRHRVWPWLAAAAVVAVAVGLAWPSPPPARPAPASTPAVHLPAIPALDGLLAAIPAGGPLSGELDAVGADLTAAVRTVRGAVPF